MYTARRWGLDTGRCLTSWAGKALLLGPKSPGPRVATELDHRLGLWSQRTVGKSTTWNITA